MSRIILTTWGLLGDLHPMISLSLGWRDRGYNIVQATTENSRIEKQLEDVVITS